MSTFTIKSHEQSHAETEAAIYAEGTPFTRDELYAEWLTACQEEGEVVPCQHVYERMLREHPEFKERWLEVEHFFAFKTDSESGHITATSFGEAKGQLDEMLTDEAIENGAWGWVADEDGNRYWVAEENSR